MMMSTTVAFLSLLVAAELGADWIVSIDGLDDDRPLSVRRDLNSCRRRDCLSTFGVIVGVIALLRRRNCLSTVGMVRDGVSVSLSDHPFLQ